MSTDEKLAWAIQALEDVTDPVSKVRRELRPGYSLDGTGCVRMLDDPETYRRIAREALAKLK